MWAMNLADNHYGGGMMDKKSKKDWLIWVITPIYAGIISLFIFWMQQKITKTEKQITELKTTITSIQTNITNIKNSTSISIGAKEGEATKWLEYANLYAKLVNEQKRIKATHQGVKDALNGQPRTKDKYYLDETDLHITGKDRAVLELLGSTKYKGREAKYTELIDLCYRNWAAFGDTTAKQQIELLDKMEYLVDSAVIKIGKYKPVVPHNSK
jgi:phosphate/sulfate permease